MNIHELAMMVNLGYILLSFSRKLAETRIVCQFLIETTNMLF